MSQTSYANLTSKLNVEEYGSEGGKSMLEHSQSRQKSPSHTLHHISMQTERRSYKRNIALNRDTKKLSSKHDLHCPKSEKF